MRPTTKIFSLIQRLRKPAAPSDETFVNAVAEHIRACARTEKQGHMYIETAGGESHS